MRLAEKILVNTIIGVAFILGATSLVFFNDTLFPYIFGKGVLMRLLTDILVALWIPLALFHEKYRPNIKSPIILAVVLFALVMSVASVFGVDPQQSFWGNQERMMGMMTLLHVSLACIVLSSVIRSAAVWKYFFAWLLLISSVVTMYGIGQHLHFFKVDAGWRPSSTFGNPIMWGGYAALHVFLGLFLLFQPFRSLSRILISMGILLNILGVYFAGSRGGVVALLVASLAMLAALPLVFTQKRKRLISYGVLTLSMVGIVSLTGWLYTEQGRGWAQASLPGDIKKVVYLTFDSPDRIALWEIGLKAFLERPIIGWGPENFHIAANKFLDTPTAQFLTHPWYDRAHNQLVDILVFGGSLGFIAYILLIATVLVPLLYLFKRGENMSVKLGVLSLGGFFGAYLLGNMTAFDSPSTLFILYIACAYVIFLTTQNKEAQKESTAEEGNIGGRHTKSARFFSTLVLSVLFFSFLTYVSNVKPFLASRGIFSAMEATTKDAKDGFSKMKSVFHSNSFVVNEVRAYLPSIVQVLLASGKLSENEKKELVSFAIEQLNKGVSQHPRDLKMILAQASLYDMAYELDHSYLQKAEDTMEKAIQLGLGKAHLYSDTVALFVRRGDLGKAKEWGDRFVEISSNQGRKARAYFELSGLYLTSGHIDLAFQELGRARELDYPIYQPNFALLLTRVLLPGKKSEKAYQYIEDAVRDKPLDNELRAYRVVVYYKSGDKKKAQGFLRELETRDKKMADTIRDYLKTLGKT